jgi:hypothetical protein
MKAIRVTRDQFRDIVRNATEDSGTDGWAWLQWRQLNDDIVEIRGSYAGSVAPERVSVGE